MKTTDQSKAPKSKPGSTPNEKDDLKSLPMPELEAQLGSSPDGLEALKLVQGLVHRPLDV